MICPECKKNRLRVMPMVSKGKTIRLCPICALIIKNETHSLPADTPFDGEVAAQYYDEEVEYAKKD